MAEVSTSAPIEAIVAAYQSLEEDVRPDPAYAQRLVADLTHGDREAAHSDAMQYGREFPKVTEDLRTRVFAVGAFTLAAEQFAA